MEYFLAIGLTLLAAWSIIRLNERIVSKVVGIASYKQSDMHERNRHYIKKKLNDKTKIIPQSLKHASENMIKIIVIEDRAYWIKDNIFYSADTQNGDILGDTADPVNVSVMSKKDMEKMLFILDNLRKGNEDDSGSTGNE
jgi:hypothetical protein